jgi:DNA-binding NarL/FixJ family response regulator
MQSRTPVNVRPHSDEILLQRIYAKGVLDFVILQAAGGTVGTRVPSKEGRSNSIVAEGRVEVRRTVPFASIVFISAHGDLSLGMQAMRDGATDFLEKPIDDEALLRSIINV